MRASKIFGKLKKLMFIKSIKHIQFIMKNLRLENVRLQTSPRLKTTESKTKQKIIFNP